MHDAAAGRVAGKQHLAGRIGDLEDIEALIEAGRLGRCILLGAAIQIDKVPPLVMDVLVDDAAVRRSSKDGKRY